MKHSKRLFSSLFYVPKYEKVSDVSFSRIIVSSVLGILLSIFCLAGLTWAWFSGSSSSAANSITAAEFKVKVKINDIEITSADGKYTLSQGKNTVTVTADGSATTGYCIVKFGENTYHTIQIFKVPAEGKPQSVTFTVNATAGAEFRITPQWGTFSNRTKETLITDSSIIGNVVAPQALTIDEPQQKTQATTSSKEENSTQSTVNAPTSQVSNVSSEPTSEVSTVSSETASTEKTAVSKTESKQETVGGDTQPLTESSSITSNVTSNNTENTTAEIENRQENAISEDGTGLNR
ncbi:MAG: hypothetical protein U0L88_01295 [Acutalibacteraceae bacterium]|nr:hypothetical protein [Acutalibacteraceae bacterium]